MCNVCSLPLELHIDPLDWDGMLKRFTKYTEASSQVGDLRPLSQCQFSADGSMIAVTSWTGLLKVWDVATSSTLKEYRAHGYSSSFL